MEASELVEPVKVALRASGCSEAFDDEILDYIEAAFADMRRVGVPEAVIGTSPLVRVAVKAYAKGHFGYDNPDKEFFLETYRSILRELAGSSWEEVEP